MPLTEFAHVTLKPTFSPSALPSAFYTAWRSALQACTRASHAPFRLYQSTSSPAEVYLVGVWTTAAAHAAFLQSPAALELARAIGEFVDLVRVRHVDVDAGEVLRQVGPVGGILRVGVQEVDGDGPEDSDGVQRIETLVGGWDMSSIAQAGARKQAFEKVREAAGGGNLEDVKGGMNGEVGGKRTWVSFALEVGEERYITDRPEASNCVRLKVFLDAGEEGGVEGE